MNYSRKDAETFLSEVLGVETPTKAQVSALLNFRRETIDAEVTEQVKEAETKVRDEFKDYVKPEDYKKVTEENASLKDSSAKATRIAKYKELNINVDDEDVLNLVDAKMKESKDIDKDLAEYVKSHPSFVKTVEKKTETKKVQFKGMEDSDKGKTEVKTMQDAVAEYYKKD